MARLCDKSFYLGTLVGTLASTIADILASTIAGTHHHSGLAGIHAELVPFHRARTVVVRTPELETEVVVHLSLIKVFLCSSLGMNKDKQ